MANAQEGLDGKTAAEIMSAVQTAAKETAEANQ